MTIIWKNITITVVNVTPNVDVLHGHFSVDTTNNTVLQFFYTDSNNHVSEDMLITITSSTTETQGADNIFVDNNHISYNGILIQPIHPLIDFFNNNPLYYPTRIRLWYDNIGFHFSAVSINNAHGNINQWDNYSEEMFVFTITDRIIQTIPTTLVPRTIPMHFSDNSLVYYKTHSLASSGSGSVRNSRCKQRRT
jgi:hypothetical protein